MMGRTLSFSALAMIVLNTTIAFHSPQLLVITAILQLLRMKVFGCFLNPWRGL